MVNLPEENVPATVGAKSDENLTAALSYISIIAVVILLTKKDSDFVQFHARQGLVLFIGEVVLWLVSMFAWSLFYVVSLVSLIFLVASIVGFIKALGGERYRLPVVADLADQVKL